MACHTVNMPYMALNLRDPVAVQAETSGHDGDGYPRWSIITFDFPALDDRPAVKSDLVRRRQASRQEVMHDERLDKKEMRVPAEEPKFRQRLRRCRR